MPRLFPAVFALSLLSELRAGAAWAYEAGGARPMPDLVHPQSFMSTQHAILALLSALLVSAGILAAFTLVRVYRPRRTQDRERSSPPRSRQQAA